MTTLHGLIVAVVAAAFALDSAPARAGTPMIDDPILLSARGESSCTGICKMKVKSKPQGSGAGSQGATPYKTYRDRLGYGNVTNGGALHLRR
jgi:hypothetical protein